LDGSGGGGGGIEVRQECNKLQNKIASTRIPFSKIFWQMLQIFRVRVIALHSMAIQ